MEIYAHVSNKNIGEIKSSLYLIIKKSYIELKMGLKEMKFSSQLKGGIYEVKFGYHSKMDEYTALMSDIPKLGDMQMLRCINNKENGKR